MKNESVINGLIRFGKILNKYRNSSDNKSMQNIYDKIHKDTLKDLKNDKIDNGINCEARDF